MPRTEARFAALDVATPSHSAGDGTLRAVCGLVPVPRPGGGHAWQVAEGAVALDAAPDGVLALAIQERPGAELPRRIALFDDRIVVLGSDWSEGATLYEFDAPNASRRMQTATLGTLFVVAITKGAGVGEPEVTLVIRGDRAVPLQPPLPPSPTSDIRTAVVSKGLDPSVYAIRYALVLRGGHLGPATAPRVLDLRNSGRYIVGEFLQSNVAVGATTFTTTGAGLREDVARITEERRKAGIDTSLSFIIGDETVQALPTIGDTGGHSVVTLPTGSAFHTAHTAADPVYLSGRVRIELQSPISGQPLALPNGVEPEDVEGLAVILSGPTLVAPGATVPVDALYGPFYHAATMAVYDGASDPPQFMPLGLEITTEELLTRPVYDDDVLTAATIAAGAVFSYNDRLILGDIVYTMPPPPRDLFPEVGGIPPPTEVMIQVEIETDGGLVRVSTGAINAAETVAGGPVAYPDARARNLDIFMRVPGFPGEWRRAQRVGLTPSPVANVAVGLVTGGSLSAGTVQAEGTVALARMGSRVYVSDLLAPRIIRARRARRLDGAGTIVGIGTNALPVSTSQFGEYPVYVLGTDGVFAGRIGSGDVAFERFDIVSRRGCLGRRAFVATGRELVYVSASGVYALGSADAPPDVPLTAPLQRETGAEDLLESLSSGTALAYHEDSRRSRREVWLSTGALTFVYGVETGTWAILDRARRAFAREGTRLVGLDADGVLHVDAGDGADADAQPFTLLTSRLHLGAVGVRKRLRKLWLRSGRAPASGARWRLFDRATSGMVLLAEGMFDASGRMEWQLPVQVTEPHLLVSGSLAPGESVDGFGLEWEPRTSHRAPSTAPEDDEDVFWTPGAPFGGRILVTDEDADSIEITTEGVLGLTTHTTSVTFFGETYTIEEVEIAPSMLGRERITDTLGTTARLLVDEA